MDVLLPVPRPSREPSGPPGRSCRGLTDPDRLRSLELTGLTAGPDGAFDGQARLARRLLGVPTALVSLVDAERQFFPGTSGFRPPAGMERETPLSHSLCQHVVMTATELVVEDARTDERVADNPAVEDLGVVAYAGMPLTDDDGQVLGSLCAIDGTPRRWSTDQLDLLRELAAVASTELRLRIAGRRLERAHQRMALLSETVQAVSSGTDPEALARAVSHVLLPDLAEVCIVDLVHEDLRQFRRYRTEAGPAGPVDHLPQQLHGPCEGLLPDVGQPAGTEVLGQALVASSGAVIGRLVLARAAAWSPDDQHLVEAIGERLASALDHARMHRQHRRTATELQRRLMPQVPPLDGLELHGTYRPAGQGLDVGGDWYDAFRLPDGADLLVLGDVAGHDVRAAGAMGQLRVGLRALALHGPTDPSVVLDRLDDLVRELAPDTMATCLVVRVEPTPRDGVRQLLWSSAGHPPALVVSPDSGTRWLAGDRPAPLLGLPDRAPRASHTATLTAGETLLLYSDGLVESRTAPLSARLRRLSEEAAERAGGELGAMCRALVETLAAEVRDDVALLGVRLR